MSEPDPKRDNPTPLWGNGWVLFSLGVVIVVAVILWQILVR